MNINLSWIQSDWTQALGWTFVHSLWQIALIGLVLFVALRIVPRRLANARYTISTMALWLIVCSTLSTFLIMLPNAGEIINYSGEVLMIGGSEALTFRESVAAWLEMRIPMMLTIWAGGVSILLIRLLFSLSWVRHVRSSSTAAPEIQQTLNSIISRLRLKVKPVAASTSLVSSPMTIGHLKPIVLFPIGILNHISPSEVEAILTHELAHIVRKDYLSNLVQSFIETLFYYHPIVWWISAMVRSERENRADDLAVTWCGDQLGYAKALMTIQEMQVSQGPSLAIGFASRKGAMLARIQRILNVPYKNHNQMEKTVLLSLTTLCFLAFTLTSHTPADQPTGDDLLIETTLTLMEETTDSIPTKGTYRIHKKTNEQEIDVEVENGNIKTLQVDGKEVAPADYKRYDLTINELFGNIKAPRSINNFDMPPPPPSPPTMPEGLYEFDYKFEMPPMPDYPPMTFDYIMDGNQFILEGGTKPDIKVITKNMVNGEADIMILINGDTTLHKLKGGKYFKLDEEMLKEYEIEWKENATQWKEQRELYKDNLHFQRDELQDQQDVIRYEIKSRNDALKNEQEHLELELYNLKKTSPELLTFRTNRVSLSEEMVKDGLVAPGSEIKVQLTPNRLKINGEKMPDAIHQKYLKIYEKQQGVELSGNSRVEFTTKSKQRL